MPTMVEIYIVQWLRLFLSPLLGWRASCIN
jgi:hypothetical protein